MRRITIRIGNNFSIISSVFCFAIFHLLLSKISTVFRISLKISRARMTASVTELSRSFKLCRVLKCSGFLSRQTSYWPFIYMLKQPSYSQLLARLLLHPDRLGTQVRVHICNPFLYLDHHLVAIILPLDHSYPRGKGVWKFSTKLLKSDDFCSAVGDF